MTSSGVTVSAEFLLGKQVGAINSWCEAAAAGAKAMSLSSPFLPELYPALLPHMQEAAEVHGTNYYLEKALNPTDLFGSMDLTGLWVFVIYKEQKTIDEYFGLQAEIRHALENDTYSAEKRLSCAYRFGELLGYSDTVLKQRLQGGPTPH